MSNLPPNPFNNYPGAPQVNSDTGPQTVNHNQQFGQVPLNQLPPGYGRLKQDPNSNSPIHGSSVNNYNQSASNSPAFNQPGMSSVHQGLQSSPIRPPLLAPGPQSSPVPLSAANTRMNPSPNIYPPSYQPQKQINDNAPTLNPSSQYNQPLVNGPQVTMPPRPALNQGLLNSSPYTSAPVVRPPVISGPVNPLYGLPGVSQPQVLSQPNVPYSNSQLAGPLRNSPLSGPPVSGTSAQNFPSTIGPPLQPPINGPSVSRPLTGPYLPASTAPPIGPMSAPVTQSYPGQLKNPTPILSNPSGPPTNQFGGLPNQAPAVPQSLPQAAYNLPPTAQTGIPPMPQSSGRSNMQNRYPQMPSANYVNQQPVPTAAPSQYAQQYNTQGLSQQMGQLSVTKQGFDQLWGHHMVDLLQCRHILPEYPEDPPEIKLGQLFAESSNCSPEIFRCTINRIPETNSLLQKSRLPLGILIHPFKDLNHLPVIQCTTIVRCRSCRTYINPFVNFVDAKRWRCNLCYRVNDLPEEFQYDPVSKSYGDPSRRPEIKSATIEFIAPGEYMLRPPQPAVYLFLFDVSQLARESGYLQVVCDTLKEHLDQLPGDARTQIGFICYDAHVHYYLMSEGLTRPKEMTVLDIDDVFLPSPESLLVNLGERRELLKELLTVLPQRYSALGVPASALGAALQAAYKLMAPTGGRVTVFQTCLPNVGPGALQPREDPNARSSKEVAHLNPATDFYKRLALDCSGAQVAVDLFLLNSQYSDLTTLSGMSKFSAGTVYHIPLFKATRTWQAEQLTRMFTRYLTRKIGFEAVMRVRCTRGLSIHTFHGNFFVRSTDLLSLPNVSPDAGFGMQLTIDESLAELQQVCFQAALLYTSSKGERRIRVHTLALPIASNLTDVLHAADQQCIIGLLSKMAVDRCMSASLGEAREALTNVAVDALSAFRLSQNLPVGAASSALHAPLSLRLLPLYLLALLKRDSENDYFNFIPMNTVVGQKNEKQLNLEGPSSKQLKRSSTAAFTCIKKLTRGAKVIRIEVYDVESYPDIISSLCNCDAELCVQHVVKNIFMDDIYKSVKEIAVKKAFRTGTSTRLDDRVADMCALKSWPLAQLLRAVYPDLYPVHELRDHLPTQPTPHQHGDGDDDDNAPDPPRLQLSAERINMNGAYLLDDGESMVLYVCHGVSPAFLSETFGVTAHSQLADEARSLPRLDSDGSALLHAFIDKLNDDRPYAADILVLRDNSPSRTLFTERLADDRVESAFSYYEFLQHVKNQVK